MENHVVRCRERVLAAVGVQSRSGEHHFVCIREVLVLGVLAVLLRAPTGISLAVAFVVGAQAVLDLRERLLILISGLN